MQVQGLVIGGGPAGLMAAEALADAGLSVLVAEQKPSFGRKFLMAGKSGLNLTKDEPLEDFLTHYDSAWLMPMVQAFGPEDVQTWAQGLEQSLFTGTTGRVFPKVMKASPLLRAWLGRLAEKGVRFETGWQFEGWSQGSAQFETPEGAQTLQSDVTILAMGGGSWARLGSDGLWASNPQLAEHTEPFQPSNIGLHIDWSEHMRPHFGKAIKAVKWTAGDITSRGEAVLSEKGLEGGGIYPLIPAVRDSARVTVDLAPDLSLEKLAARLPKSPKGGLTKILRNTLRWPPEKIAFFHEFRPVTPLDGGRLAQVIKAFQLPHLNPRPIDEAISTAGGLQKEALNDGLMLRDLPGVFACGEMLDWDAPTGGYLLTACFATGRWAGQHAAQFVTSRTS